MPGTPLPCSDARTTTMKYLLVGLVGLAVAQLAFAQNLAPAPAGS
jgi:hypothetical protein